MLNGFFRGCILLLAVSSGVAGQLERNFLHPPPTARPWVFWFWLNGNITSNGITVDLEAMRRVGIGGVVIMDVDQGTPKGPIVFNSPEWVSLFKHTCSEAHRLGMQVNINNDAGWAGSGGPWITPDVSMQKLVWSETRVTGGKNYEGLLKQPETVRGFYRDICVLALPSSETDAPLMRDRAPTISASIMGPNFDPAKLMDGDITTAISLPRPDPGKPQFVQIAFPQPFRCRRLWLNTPGLTSHKMCHAVLAKSEDGTNFANVREFNAEATATSINFPETAARVFRVRFENAEPYLESLNISEIELSPYSRIDNYQEKALFVPRSEYSDTNRYALLPPDSAIRRERQIDLTSKIDASGHLHWGVPPGDWIVLRFGHTSTGEDNQPAPESGRGLECDKLSKAGAAAAFNGFIGKLVDAVGPLAGKTFAATHVDSWEVGAQNWTGDFRGEFERRRNYDPIPFLPVLTGRVVESIETSERFLWDLRQTVSELVVENYAGGLSALARKHGMYLTMEAYDLNPCDDLMFAGRVDQPMAEFWTWPPYGVAYSCMEMTSAGHVYGKPIVSGEAFTATDTEKWLGHPYGVKVFGDWAFCHGINRFILHRYAHQPWTEPTRYPGMAMGPWGLHYERTQTWWEQSKPWHEYLSRCQYLLQQGRFCADICYVSAEESPNRWYVPGKSRERPGYNYDACPPELVIQKMFVRDHKVCLPAEQDSSGRERKHEANGPAYRILVLPESDTMTPELLRKVKELVERGATVIGKKPSRSPSLTGFPKCDSDVKAFANELWGWNSGMESQNLPSLKNGLTIPQLPFGRGESRREGSVSASQSPGGPEGFHPKEHRLGKGRVISGLTADQVLAADRVAHDFECSSKAKPQAIRYIHKILGTQDLYFLANKFSEPEDAICAFRVNGKTPRLLKPDSGQIERSAVFEEVNGAIRMPIHFDSFGSVFVLFSPAEISTEPLKLVTRNGIPVISPEYRPEKPQATDSNASVTASFTMAAWVRPDIDTDTPEETTVGISGLHVMRNDVLYPPPGEDLYSGSRDAGSGFSVGLNGVCVYEHAASYFAPTLVQAISITNWTHVAIVYRDNRPALYVNGKLVRQGIKSEFNVHPGVGVVHKRGVAPFRGEMGELVQFDRPLKEDELAQLATSTPLPFIALESEQLKIIRNGRNSFQAEVRVPGTYELTSANGRKRQFVVHVVPVPVKIDAPWIVAFPKRDGHPVKATWDDLIPWNEFSDPAIKYFSGTAAYKTDFDLLTGGIRASQKVYLNLGTVAVMADVSLNGNVFTTLWKPPFELDVTHAIRPGRNQLEIRITNLWPNRMIGDEQLPEDSKRKPNGTLEEWPDWLLKSDASPTGRQTFTSWRLWKRDGVLQRSGLLGPVKLTFAEQVDIR